jgi:hypothetical protein
MKVGPRLKSQCSQEVCMEVGIASIQFSLYPARDTCGGQFIVARCIADGDLPEMPLQPAGTGQ